MAKKVIVYMADWCPWCHRAMDFLTANKIPFEARDVEQGNNAQESMKKSGQAGIPVIDIDGTIIVGFDQAKLKELLKIK
ncbi:MAG TPA: glutaredoxin domain-containing protein [Candidatus Bilamarchaeum sp.]|nr:glutaredoxin domain-containing protein [Candidatus Bilamarchaeum sp.]